MKSCLLQLLVLFIVVAAFTTDGTAKDKHLPLPPQITAAKSVFIDNQSGISNIGDKCYQEIQKWGRFQVVQDRKQADLILLLSAREYTRGYATTGGETTGTISSSGTIDTTSIGNQTTGSINSSGTINTTSQPTYTRPVTVRYTYITVIDPKTGDNLWSASKPWGGLYTGFHSATKGLIDDLMKRMEGR